MFIFRQIGDTVHPLISLVKSWPLGISALGNFSVLGYYSHSHHINFPSVLHLLKRFKYLSAATHASNDVHQD